MPSILTSSGEHTDGGVHADGNIHTDGGIQTDGYRRYASTYLLRDEFRIARLAGALNGTPAEPGPGTRSVTDTGNYVSIGTQGYLFATDGAASWNDPHIWYDESTNRANYGAVTGLFRRRLTTNSMGLFISNTKAPSDPTAAANGVYFFNPHTELRVSGVGTANLNPISRWRSIDYMLALILRPDGGLWHLISGGTLGTFPSAKLVWVSHSDSLTDLYSGITANDGAWKLLNLWAVGKNTAFAWSGDNYSNSIAIDSFTRADGDLDGSETGRGNKTWTLQVGSGAIASNKAVLSVDGRATIDCGQAASSQPRILTANVITPATGAINAGIIFRWTDSSNYSTVLLRSSTNQIHIYENDVSVNSSALTPANDTTYRITVIDYGTFVSVFVDSVIYITRYSTSVNNSATEAGIQRGGGVSDNGSLHDDFEAWPMDVTLPINIGEFPSPPVGSGDNLASDDFTDTNGTALTDHDVDWTTGGTGNWEINSNQARIDTADTQGNAIQDIGNANHESSAAITLPSAPSTNDWFCGVVVRYVDENNFLFARYLYQSNSPEIEIWEKVGGVGNIICAVSFAAGTLNPTSTYTMKLAVTGNQAAAYHEGELVAQVITQLLTGTKCGMGINGTSEGQPSFDDWAAKAT